MIIFIDIHYRETNFRIILVTVLISFTQIIHWPHILFTDALFVSFIQWPLGGSLPLMSDSKQSCALFAIIFPALGVGVILNILMGRPLHYPRHIQAVTFIRCMKRHCYRIYFLSFGVFIPITLYCLWFRVFWDEGRHHARARQFDCSEVLVCNSSLALSSWFKSKFYNHAHVLSSQGLFLYLRTTTSRPSLLIRTVYLVEW